MHIYPPLKLLPPFAEVSFSCSSSVLNSSSATMLSSSSFYLFLLFSICIITSISPSSSKVLSYNDHCSSIVPQTNLTIPTLRNSMPSFSTTYITGGDRLLRGPPENRTRIHSRTSVTLRIQPGYHDTIAKGVYKVEGVFLIRIPNRNLDARSNYTYGGYYHRRSRPRRLITFSLQGFWSEVSRKLCMVGSGVYNDVRGKIVILDAVLKLNYGSENNPTLNTSVVSGSLQSIASENDEAYFEPISVFSFPHVPNYSYSFVSNIDFSSSFNLQTNQSLSIESDEFCSILGWRTMYLEMEYVVNATVGAIVRPLPRFLHLTPIECSEVHRKLRYTATFRNMSYDDQSFGIESMVIGEASWDDKKNMLVGVMCRLFNPLSHFEDAVGDCTLRLSLRYPSFWTIRSDAKIVGQIWSSKSVDEMGYFREISLTNRDVYGVVPFPGPRYEYTEMDRVRKSCEKMAKKKGNTYPDGHSYNMRFDMSVKSIKGDYVAWGYATPLSVGDDLYHGNNMLVDAMAPQSVIAISEPINLIRNVSPVNISYKISINYIYLVNSSSIDPHQEVEITAEGVYNGETGYLCMVGCKKLDNYSANISTDCEILLRFKFPKLDEKRGGFIKGTIKSTRAKEDPLHFDELLIQSAAYYDTFAEQSIWRMDLEITMVLISNAFACIFVVLQIFHVKRNPEVPSFISIVMLVVLSVGNMIPLMLNFEAVFLENHNKKTLSLSNGGRLEANEIAVRVITMVAFLLQLRLLQLAWTAKQSDASGNEKISWAREKKAGFVSLALYSLGGLMAVLLNWTKNRYANRGRSPYSVDGRYSVWGDLRSYGGLILDGFLLPQILLNIFVGSAEKALSGSFYMGTSAVRLVPHAYNQYRVHSYSRYDLNSTYYYANPEADFYSTAWDIIIPSGVMALAVIVFVQQRHGGRCILPRRLRGLEMYEKVPAVDTE